MRKIAIACLNKNLAIGLKNNLIFNIPSEFALFKKHTNSINKDKPNIILMGRKTFESIGNKPLPNRFNCVISSNSITLTSMYRYSNLKFFVSIEECMEHFKNKTCNYGDMYICGGTSIYDYFIQNNLLDLAYMSYITNYPNNLGDAFFPNHSIIKNYTIIHKELFSNKDATINSTGENIKLDYEFIIYFNNKNDKSDLYNKIKISVLEELDHYKELVKLSPEQQYLDTLNNVLQWGRARKSRNAVVLSKFGQNMEFDISNSFPLLTTKKVFWKGVLHELLWFIKGDTNSKNLSDKGVKIWDGNTTREYLDSIGLKDYKEGECGPIYGYQWRHFNATYRGCDADYTNTGVDQLGKIVELIKNDPFSRRMIMSGWNPEQLSQMCLPPCHVSYQFYVEENPSTHVKYLSCSMYQRSGDMFLGVPFNIASTAALTYIIADLTNCKPKKITINIGDAHIYKEHIDAVQEQLKRTPYDFPTLTINGNHNCLEDYKYEDFIVENYNSHPTIKAKMIA